MCEERSTYGRRISSYGNWGGGGDPRESDLLEDLGIDGRVILKVDF